MERLFALTVTTLALKEWRALHLLAPLPKPYQEGSEFASGPMILKAQLPRSIGRQEPAQTSIQPERSAPEEEALHSGPSPKVQPPRKRGPEQPGQGWSEE